MNILKNYSKLFLIVAASMVFSCCAEKSSVLVLGNVVENAVVASIANTPANINDSDNLLADLSVATENILATFNKSLIKNNKADLMGTLLAIMMMMSYSSVGCVPPHVASSATLVHAIGSMLNQKIKNDICLDRAENIEELKKNIQQLMLKNPNSLYAEKIFNITDLIEKKILSETKSNKKAYLVRIIATMPFIIGFFIFSEFNATSKLYPEVVNEIKNLTKANSHDKNRVLTEAENQAVEIQAGLGVSVEAWLRLGFGFSEDGNYYMYPWLVGAILEFVNLYYINSSNGHSSKISLDKIKEIKKMLME